MQSTDVDVDREVAQRELMENSFCTLISLAQDILDSEINLHRKSCDSQLSVKNDCNIKLPTIDLPKFDGSYLKWMEFRDTFDALVNKNESIPEINKFHYLRSSLQGGASVVINSIEFTANNFSLAWELICNRYNNNRILVNNHIKCLFNFDPITKESYKSLRYMIDYYTKNLRALESLKEPTTFWDTFIIYMMSSKLDGTTSRKWEEHKNGFKDSPSLQEFYTFLRNRADVLETLQYGKPETSKAEKQSQYRDYGGQSKSFIAASNNNYSPSKSCAICKQNHFVHECHKFRKMRLDDRLTQVATHRLCQSCLRPNHSYYRCRVARCKVCLGKHNTLLHNYKNNDYTNKVKDSNPPPHQPENKSDGCGDNPQVSLSATVPSQVLLCTAEVELVDLRTNNTYLIKALLDNGSQSSFITEEVQRKMNLICTDDKSISISGINNNKTKIHQSCVIAIKSRLNSFNFNVSCLVIPQIASRLPNVEIDPSRLCLPVNIQLADPTFYRPSDIHVLLGADVFWDIVQSRQIKLGRNKPTLQESKLGWLVAGPLGGLRQSHVKCNFSREVRELTNSNAWRHVPTELNPTDLVSRGAAPQQIQNNQAWWHGPSYLFKPESEWPSNIQVTAVLPETKVFFNNNVEQSIVPFDRFSKLYKLQRSFAYVLRFINNCKRNNTRCSGNLTHKELQQSLITLSKISQQESFPQDIHALKHQKTLNKKSTIISLNPFLDENDILRVGGRIDSASHCTYDKKHSILISSKHHFTQLLFESQHLRLLHCGPSQLLATVREQFWPTRGKSLASSVVHRCVRCQRFKAKVVQQPMGKLPEPRVTPSSPFETCGVDMAGPFRISSRKGRGAQTTKCYLCIFVCFSIKAVHLEVVSELSTNAFISCLRRFIARRGKPKTIYCDNGKNFVGANNELGRLIKTHNRDVSDYAGSEAIEFKFSPAYAPNFGGIWEAGVKTAKFHLKRIASDKSLTFEELSTLFAQIEAIMNSRPLTPLSMDPSDLAPLTPGHFLIGRPLTSLPPVVTQRISVTRYQLIERLRQHFWSRWTKEYLSELQRRTKWHGEAHHVRIGDLVIIKEEQLPPMQWLLGRINKLYHGPDGVCRVVDVSTKKGLIKRALSKICPLNLETKDFEGAQDVKHSA